MGIDELSTDRPMRRRRPLRAGGRDGSIQGVKIRHLDAVEQSGHTPAGHHLQSVGSVPFGREALHRTGRQIEPRLKPRQVDVGRVDVAQVVVGLPTAVECHATLPQGQGTPLSLLRRAFGRAHARRCVERPCAVGDAIPLRLGDDAIFLEVFGGTAVARSERAHHPVDLQRTGQTLIAAGRIVTLGNVGRQRSAGNESILINGRAR